MPFNRPGKTAAARAAAFAIEPDVDSLRRLLGAAAALLAEAHLLGQLRARGRVAGRDHRIVGAERPFFPILLGRHVVLRAQMPLERLEFLAVFQTDNVFRRDRLLHRNRRPQRLGRGIAGFSRHPGERGMHLVDQARGSRPPAPCCCSHRRKRFPPSVRCNCRWPACRSSKLPHPWRGRRASRRRPIRRRSRSRLIKGSSNANISKLCRYFFEYY